MKKKIYQLLYNLLSFTSCHISNKRIVRWKIVTGSVLLFINGHSKTPLMPLSNDLSSKDINTIQSDSLKSKKNSRVITGTIIDTYNEPLIGANITIKGTTTHVNSDFDGNFKLEVPADTSTISISYIGYKSVEVAVPSSPCTIILEEDDTNLSCYIVVTGYCIRKEDVEKNKIEIKTKKKKIPFINKKDTTQTK